MSAAPEGREQQESSAVAHVRAWATARLSPSFPKGAECICDLCLAYSAGKASGDAQINILADNCAEHSNESCKLALRLASAAEREKGLREALAKALEWSANFPLGGCDGIPSEADRIAANDVYVAARDVLKPKT